MKLILAILSSESALGADKTYPSKFIRVATLHQSNFNIQYTTCGTGMFPILTYNPQKKPIQNCDLRARNCIELVQKFVRDKFLEQHHQTFVFMTASIRSDKLYNSKM